MQSEPLKMALKWIPNCKIISIFILVSFVTSCAKNYKEKNPIYTVLSSDNPLIRKVSDSLEQYEVQILFTRVKQDKNNFPLFEDFEFQVNDSSYFYPASTVKLPVAVLALEKLHTEQKFDGNTKFYVEGDSVETTFYKEISKIFAVSDNDAYNRLFEFLGPDYVNKKLEDKKLIPSRISHRLSVPDAFNLKTKSLVVYLNDSTVTPTRATVNHPPEKLSLKNITKGMGYMQDDELVKEPFDFSEKNYLPLRTLHNMMKRLIFPEAFKPEEVFDLDSSAREFLLDAMHKTPGDAGYNRETFYDSYGKFFIYGDSKDSIPQTIYIYNKVGYAYGTLTDCAYIEDTKNKISFFITATIMVNKNGIFNDDIYEYETIGIPFLAALGRALYKQELNLR